MPNYVPWYKTRQLKKQNNFKLRFRSRKQHLEIFIPCELKQNTVVLMNSKIYKVEVVCSEWQQFQ